MILWNYFRNTLNKTGESSSRFPCLEDGYKFVIVKGYFENKYTATIPGNSFTLSAVVNNTYIADGYDVRIQFFRDKYFEIDAYTDLDYVLCIQIPENFADTFETAAFTLGLIDDLSTPSFTRNTDGTLTSETDNLYELSNSIPSDKAGADVGNLENTTKTISIGETMKKQHILIHESSEIKRNNKRTLKREQTISDSFPPVSKIL